MILETGTGAGEISGSYEAELRAVLEAVKMAEGPCTVVTDSAVIVRQVEKLVNRTADTRVVFRAPNSKHPKTGSHKRRLSYDELMHLSADRIWEQANEPLGFEVPDVTTNPTDLETDWAQAEALVRERQGARAGRDHTAGSRLQRDTLEFIRNGAEEGERQNRLFRAAGNLREHGAPAELVHALLVEAALDSGLSPSEVTWTITCGIESSDTKPEGGAP